MVPCTALHAESLRDALIRAHDANPVLRAQRHTVPAAEAGVDRARSGFMPRVNGSSDIGYLHRDTRYRFSGSQPGETRPRSVAIEMTQTVYDGGRTGHSVRQAGHTLSAAQEELRNIEQGTMLEAAGAYLDVVRDMLTLEFERQNLASLQEQLALIEGLYRFGDVTEVDVLQVKSRVAEARARVSGADGNLRGNSAVYNQIIGHAPKGLRWPRAPEALSPTRVEAAMAQLIEHHPSVMAAKATALASQAKVDATRGEYLPTLSVVGSLARRNAQELAGSRSNEVSLLGRLSVPFYTGGETAANLREAREVSHQRVVELDVVRARVRADISKALAQHRASMARLAAVRQQLEGASKALKGLRDEFSLGQRAAIAVLDGVQDLLNANIALANAQRDKIASAFNLARAMGHLALDDVMRLSGTATEEPSRLFSSQPRSLERRTSLRLRTSEPQRVDDLRLSHAGPLVVLEGVALRQMSARTEESLLYGEMGRVRLRP